MMEGLVSHMREAAAQWSDHHNSVYNNLMIDSFFFTQIGSKFALAGRGVSAAGSWLSRIRTWGHFAKEKGQWGDQAQGRQGGGLHIVEICSPHLKQHVFRSPLAYSEI